jgi:hypothetical protein
MLSILLALALTSSTMAKYTTTSPVTRIACFRFGTNVTAEQKGDRTSAFLNLYAQHPELLLVPPKGGRPLTTPLDLTNVKRDKEWDTGFIVVFKVWVAVNAMVVRRTNQCRAMKREKSSIMVRGMIS